MIGLQWEVHLVSLHWVGKIKKTIQQEYIKRCIDWYEFKIWSYTDRIITIMQKQPQWLPGRQLGGFSPWKLLETNMQFAPVAPDSRDPLGFFYIFFCNNVSRSAGHARLGAGLSVPPWIYHRFKMATLGVRFIKRDKGWKKRDLSDELEWSRSLAASCNMAAGPGPAGQAVLRRASSCVRG